MIYVAGGIFAAVATRLLRLLVRYHTESAADFSVSKHERVGLSGKQEPCVIGLPSKIGRILIYERMTDPAPMTLANMRVIGIRTLSMHCRCRREREVNDNQFDGALVVIRMHRHFRCGECGQRPYSVRPGPMGCNAIGAGSGHWTGERDPLYRPGDEALLRW